MFVWVGAPGPYVPWSVLTKQAWGRIQSCGLFKHSHLPSNVMTPHPRPVCRPVTCRSDLGIILAFLSARCTVWITDSVFVGWSTCSFQNLSIDIGWITVCTWTDWIYPELYIKLQSVPRSKHTVPLTKTSQLMLCREIIAVCSQIYTKHINTVCGQSVELLNVKVLVGKVTTGL
jgi:hypothetical protein